MNSLTPFLSKPKHLLVATLVTGMSVIGLTNCKSSQSGDADKQVVATAPTDKPEPKEEIARGCQTEIERGVQGLVIYKEGNHMPSPDEPRNVVSRAEDAGKLRSARSEGRPISREIHIYTLTNLSEVTYSESSEMLYNEINTEHVMTVMSDEKGCFQAELPGGVYSFFVREKRGFFANRFDEESNINPVYVEESGVIKMVIM